MILIGQFDSPFVRRIGIALETYGRAYEHKPWSTFGDADQIARYNPTLRVPTLVFDDGAVMVDTHAILLVLDAAAPPARRLTPADPDQMRSVWRICGFASGVSDKAVQLFYVTMFAKQVDSGFVARMRAQIGDTLDLLEREAPQGWWVGDAITHADIAMASTYRHFSEAYAGQFEFARWPALKAHSERCEKLPVFEKIQQPFVFTPPKD